MNFLCAKKSIYDDIIIIYNTASTCTKKLFMFVMFWQLLLANPGPIVIEKLQASKLSDLIGEDKIFLTVGDAVTTFGPKGLDLWRTQHNNYSNWSVYLYQI